VTGLSGTKDPEAACRDALRELASMQSPTENAAWTKGAGINHLVERCSTEFPGLADHLRSEQARWERDNAMLARARAKALAMPPEQERMLEVLVARLSDSMLDYGAAVANSREAACRDVVASTAEYGEEVTTFEQAAREFRQQAAALEVLGPVCAARSPALASQVAAAQAAWDRREAPLIATTRAHFEKLRASDPAEVAEFEGSLRRALTWMFEENARNNSDNGDAYCRDLVERAAAGTWRSDQPEVLQLLVAGNGAD
jgi:hypothetical protein